MTICGVLVHAKANAVKQLAAQLQARSGIEIHAHEQGRLIVTICSDHDQEAADAILAMQGLDGVLSASLVYHYSDQQESAN